MSRKLSTTISFVTALFLALSVVAFGAPASQAADDPCAAQVSALEQIHSKIEAHNSEPHTFIVPEQQAEADAYDAEASALNASESSAQTALKNCEETLGALVDQGPNSAPLQRPSAKVNNKIQQLKDQLPPNVQQYDNPGSGGYWRVPPELRPLYDALRSDNPGSNFGSPYLQGQPRPSIGDPDAAFPNDVITAKPGDPNVSNVSPDHIVSIPEIMNMPGFTQLSAENMYTVTRAPINYQWLSYLANSAKSSREVAYIENMDPTFVEEQTALHDSVRSQLESIIQKMIANQ